MGTTSKYFLAAIALIGLIAMGWIGINNKSGLVNNYDLLEVKLRSIGHELLSAANDHSSRVLPIEQISEQEYRIQFEHPFSFTPDSLVTIVRNHLEDSILTRPFLMQVLSCQNAEVVYSFEISGHQESNIIPCVGRQIPTACYTLRLKFKQPAHRQSLWWFGFLLLPLILWMSILWKKKSSPETNIDPQNKEERDQATMKIGAYRFDGKTQNLYWNEEKTTLSAKESELLCLFIQSPNQLLQREYLLKTIWEDQGVIVGRSLDVFVSKLRKKLIHDPSIQLVSVHGKGYKLEVASDQV